MPLYEYRCKDCGHALETIQRLSDAPLTKCPACGHKALKKQITAAGFQLRGGGWYATDFKNRGAKPAASESGADKGGGAASAPGDAPAPAPAPKKAGGCGSGGCSGH